ncbi:CRISPR-associated protein Cas4 [Peptococcaceae bacterium 1198_IL3148]
MYRDEVKVGGTLIWYYYVCKREVWLMAHQITPDQDDTNVVLGRFFAEQSYNRNKKEVAFGHMKFDIVKKGKDGLVVGEVKKSSKFRESARMQLAYYLLELHINGIKAKGELLFPREKRKEIIELNEDLIIKLKNAEKEILQIIHSPVPPDAKKINFCNKCAYAELCWA